MDSRAYQKLKQLYREARELRGEERRAFLERMCAQDLELRAEVENLLGQETELGGFLERPASTDVAPEPLPSSHPERIGAYRILRVLGWGGMGVVYLAEQDSPRRAVALKVLRADVATPARQARFEREAELLGRLHHPGLAQVYQAGWAETETGARPFFAMEYVEGKPLLVHAEEEKLGLGERVALVRQIAEAVQHAHEHGVVHRDLKPSNVLVDAEGRPKVLDFGVARPLVGAGERQTEPGQLVGTLAYMSPEQASGERAPDPASDVYSLGVLLYELVTDRTPIPIEGLALHQAVRAIREEEPLPAGSLRRELRGDLEVILGKALEKEPARRYGSASELAADLGRFLEHRPILARPPSTAYLAWKLVRRHRALAGAFLALILVLSVGLLVERRQRRRAEEALQRAELAQRKADFRYDTVLLQREQDRLKDLSRLGQMLLKKKDVSLADLEVWQADAWRFAGRVEQHQRTLIEVEKWYEAPPRGELIANREERAYVLEVQRDIVRRLEELTRSGTGLLPRIQSKLHALRGDTTAQVEPEEGSRP